MSPSSPVKTQSSIVSDSNSIECTHLSKQDWGDINSLEVLSKRTYVVVFQNVFAELLGKIIFLLANARSTQSAYEMTDMVRSENNERVNRSITLSIELFGWLQLVLATHKYQK